MSLRIAIVGYGRMGQAVEQEALGRGHNIVARIGLDNQSEMDQLSPDVADAIIEFTHPETALPNFRRLLPSGVPLVTGTTGWLSELEILKTEVLEAGQAFLYSSNFSPGVNILFRLNKMLSRIMNQYPEFDGYVSEAHHRHKKDAPSGTAISLAEQMLEGLDRKTTWVRNELSDRSPAANELSVASTRAGEIIGRHKVSYISDIEEIEISHQAFNRRGFALGAVLAAEWLTNKRGFYNFTDIFE
ncbi:MAG TPA: 4-hydroxy-tetrahydrodipicolinate reductase [Bacteroidetes bacterium]|nr:4-hydroxy-tetrahydrodipicolinate reductase [Bacteroidota bacterium]